jgi:hypothetical protein
MPLSKSDWWVRAIKKYGSEEQVRATMRERRSQARSIGISNLPKEKLREISLKGVQAKREKANSIELKKTC